jgi:hypothetical protein
MRRLARTDDRVHPSLIETNLLGKDADAGRIQQADAGAQLEAGVAPDAMGIRWRWWRVLRDRCRAKGTGAKLLPLTELRGDQLSGWSRELPGEAGAGVVARAEPLREAPRFPENVR